MNLVVTIHYKMLATTATLPATSATRPAVAPILRMIGTTLPNENFFAAGET